MVKLAGVDRDAAKRRAEDVMTRWGRAIGGMWAAAALAACVSVTATEAPSPRPAPYETTASFAAHAGTAAPRGLDAGRIAKLDAAMKAFVDSGELGGAVLVVRRDGEEVFARAWGWRDKEAGDAASLDTMFRIASQTKAVVSTAVMMLVEDGRILLDDPVGKHLPEWRETKVAVAREGGGYDVVPARRPITVRDLLTHTAGLSYGTGPAMEAWTKAGIVGWYFADRTEPVREVVRRMAALPMAAQPGTQFVYGYNTDVLGALVEEVSGQSLDAFLKARILDPLGMSDTHFYVPPQKASRLAVVYSADPAGVKRAPTPGANIAGSHIGQGHYVDGPRVAFSGGAGLVSTARDYSRFLQMMLDGGRAPDGARLLSRKTVELMTRDHLTEAEYPEGRGFGLGFRILTDPGKAGQHGTEGEFSWGGAYHSIYWVDPAEGLTVSYMTNLIPAGAIDDHGKVRALIYQALE